MSTNNYRREILLRRANGKRVIDRFKEKIEGLTQADFDDAKRLSLEESDKLIDLDKKLICTLEFSSFAECLDRLEMDSERSACYLLIDGDWTSCGAYLIDPLRLNKNYSFYGTGSDGIKLIYPDWDCEIWIDLFVDSQGDYFEYQKYKRSFCGLKR